MIDLSKKAQNKLNRILKLEEEKRDLMKRLIGIREEFKDLLEPEEVEKKIKQYEYSVGSRPSKPIKIDCSCDNEKD